MGIDHKIWKFKILLMNFRVLKELKTPKTVEVETTQNFRILRLFTWQLKFLKFVGVEQKETETKDTKNNKRF